MEKRTCTQCLTRDELIAISIKTEIGKDCHFCLECSMKYVTEIDLKVRKGYANYLNEKSEELVSLCFTLNDLIENNRLPSDRSLTLNRHLDANEQIKHIIYGTTPKTTPEKPKLHKVHELVGMENVKEQLDIWIAQVNGRKKLKAKGINVQKAPMTNIMISGAPGVGKTVLAEYLTELLYDTGMISEKKFTLVRPDDIIGQHVGNTAPKTQEKIQKAMGGVFFLDEAYELAGGALQGTRGNFGNEALQVIMQAMEKQAGKMAFIFASYEDHVDDIYGMNDGLESRFSQHFHLKDYTVEELLSIGELMLKQKGFQFKEAKDTFRQIIEDKTVNGVLSGNARTIRTFIEKIVTHHLVYIGKEDVKDVETVLPETINQACSNQISDKERQGLDELYQNAQKELQEMIGLYDLKAKIKRIANLQRSQRRRREKGLKTKKITNHMFFYGPPGSGKTTVARLVGKLLRGAGVLENGHVVEVTKDDLTSATHVSRQVKRMVRKARGGILFIDEAYMLANDGDGQEAVDTLIREMEEYRDEIVVIFAGYEKDMQRLLLVNQGLKSRVPNHVYFEEYSASQLLEIAHQFIEQNEYELDEEAEVELEKSVFEFHQKGYIDGNGRWVRNLVDRIIEVQGDRVEENNSNDLTTINSMDIKDAFYELEPKEKDSFEKEKGDLLESLRDLEQIKGLASLSKHFKDIQKEPKHA